MTNGRTQDLTEAFAHIIKMMLASIRAQGLRGLIHLPMLIRFGLELRRVGREFAALMAAFKAGTLPPPPPAPPLAPWITQATISISRVTAAPLARDEMVNAAILIMRKRLRPRNWAIQPEMGSTMALATR